MHRARPTDPRAQSAEFAEADGIDHQNLMAVAVIEQERAGRRDLQIGGQTGRGEAGDLGARREVVGRERVTPRHEQRMALSVGGCGR